MTGHVGSDQAPDWFSQQIEVSDEVEYLVTDKLIGESQFSVHDLFIVYEDEVV